ncbi:MAG: SPOR domain-containing protein [Sphingobacteriales bacterium]|nr:SPOR domain-containing protein [Sphingobacteriales bacterium]
MQIKNNIAKYIKALLYEYSSIIVPDLGTFNTHYTAAQVDKEQQIITPPAKVLVFNDRIKVNDGLLAGHISRLEKLPNDVVEREIALFVRDINQRLTAAETVVIDGIGELYREGDSVKFKPVENANFAIETFGLTPVELPGADLPPTINDMAKVGAGASILTTKVEEETPVGENLQTLGSGSGSNDTKRSISSVIAANNAGGSVVATENANEKKNRWWLWLLPLLLLFAFLFTLSQLGGETDKPWQNRKPFSYIFGDGTEQVAATEEPTESAENDAASMQTEDSIRLANAAAATADSLAQIHIADSIAQATAAAERHVVNPPTTSPEKETPAQTTTATNANDGGIEVVEGLRIMKSKANEYVKTNDPKGYYIITGAFKEKSRANKLASNLRKDNLDVHILQTTSGFYRTGIFVKSGKIADVKKQFNTAQSKYNPDSWVLKYN